MRNEFINDGAWAGTSECFDCWPNVASVLRISHVWHVVHT
ncbi:hypothetical protein PAMC26577_29040 [Caballeronia sordidicola]|uniref:Uncharacterized protein n=1 Tax=Caballeronia sordidicola TaxID=196367 RepID=A0A242MGA5_CABSO|nr:hypothetical protein PAMC26577_29040 [Caballeronia sordidicola]